MSTAVTPGSFGPPVGAERSDVIVDLAVAWEPESGLSPEAASAQQARIERTQDAVVRALGTHGTLLQRLTATAQMVVSVDAQGRSQLAGDSRVAAIHDDTAQPPAGTG